MLVTGIEKKGIKNEVYIDYEFAFVLYGREIDEYGIAVGSEIDEEVYRQIIEEVVLRRAKQKAMAILKTADKSEAEIRRKLKSSMYNDEVTERTIEFLYSYRYLDDVRYTEHYLLNNKHQLSSREMRYKLAAKGIKSDEIERAYENIRSLEQDIGNVAGEEEDEIKAAVNCVRKKLGDRKNPDYKEVQKVMAYMYRKGFGYPIIRKAMEHMEIEYNTDEEC